MNFVIILRICINFYFFWSQNNKKQFYNYLHYLNKFIFRSNLSVVAKFLTLQRVYRKSYSFLLSSQLSFDHGFISKFMSRVVYSVVRRICPLYIFRLVLLFIFMYFRDFITVNVIYVVHLLIFIFIYFIFFGLKGI